MTRLAMMYFFLFVLFHFSVAHEEHPLAVFRRDVSAVPNIVPSIKMVAYPTLLTTSPAWVTLNITGVVNPTVLDTVGIFSPGIINIYQTSPVRLLYGSRFGGKYLQTGSVSISLLINNLRENVTFGLFLNNTRTWIAANKKVLSAQSNVISFQNPNIPSQIHISSTGRAGEMRVMWTTGTLPNDSQALRLGLASKTYSISVTPTSVNHTASDMCASPAIDWGWRDTGSLWMAEVKGLIPGKRYFYSVGSALTTYSNESYFTAPSDASTVDVTRFALVGDMGVTGIDGTSDRRGPGPGQTIPLDVTRSMSHLIDRDLLDMVLIIGDVSYAQGFGATWEAYKEQMRPVAQRVPFLTITGNHEADWFNIPGVVNSTDSTGECNGAYEKRYGTFMPKQTREESVQWWSIDQGPVHVIAMSTEHHYAPGSPQGQWMAADLQNVNRTKTPWIIVAGHRPMYNHLCIDYDLVQYIEPLLIQHKVDAMYVGHLHSYQRGCQMVAYQCTNNGPTHVLVGSANGGFHAYNNIAGMVKGGSTLPGFVSITANRTHFVHEFMSTNNTVQDRFVLKLGYNSNLVYNASLSPPPGKSSCTDGDTPLPNDPAATPDDASTPSASSTVLDSEKSNTSEFSPSLSTVSASNVINEKGLASGGTCLLLSLMASFISVLVA
ncbi:putative Nucleotide pyrophosphatase/phosphodiesterase [Planoprotostelium fungivorum]|uniref:Purple acid phosphatase n=1 Tax=Planoprotostelium fungivorum TaxID=1890364 RepID=A0A2P6NBI5_9EUKA|nr:putative Nucleotide pyrophosphatase/phosphodiesterase [Planoprotostelium fungivorum]